MKKTNANSRGIFGILLILFICALLVAGVKYLSGLEEDSNFYEDIRTETEKLTQRIDFEEPDYDADIFEDASYLDLNRYIEYSSPDGVSVTVTDGNYGKYHEALHLFASYFDALMMGDAEALAALHGEAYKAEHPLPERFTMQRVYDINVALKSTVISEEADTYGDKIFVFRVAYKIMKNDGTFRSDMGSGEALPLLFEVTMRGDTTLITNIGSAKGIS